MKLVATFHQPSSVVQSLKCRLTDQSAEHLVVAKSNRLEVFALGAHGLDHKCTLDVWGRVLTVRAIPVPNTKCSTLLLMTDHPEPKLLFLAYAVTDGAPTLCTTHELHLGERNSRPTEYFTDVLVDPSGRYAIVSAYAGKLKFLFFKGGTYKDSVDLSISEITLLSLAFLTTDTLAMLSIDHRERIQLHARDLYIDDKASQAELSSELSGVLPSTIIPLGQFPLPDAFPSVIAIPPLHDHDDYEEEESPGGVVVIGGTKALFFEIAPQDKQEKFKGKQARTALRRKSTDKSVLGKAREKDHEREGRGRKPNASVQWPWSNVSSWCQIDETSRRFLIGDVYGRLAMLSLANLESHGLVLIPLGQTSPATCMTYLTNQVLYVGSHLGDSTLLKVETAPNSSQDTLTLPIPSNIETVSPSELLSSSKGKGRDQHGLCTSGHVISGQGNYLTPVESFKSIAPIMDAVLVDTDGSGQPSIVTCSGGGNTGSVNVIRKGTDFEELAAIDGVRNVASTWPIRASYEDVIDTYILASTLQESLLFRLDGDSTISYVDSDTNGFVSGQPTLALQNMLRRFPKKKGVAGSSYANSSLVVQVTPTGVKVVEFNIAIDTFCQVGEPWTPERQARQDPTWRDREIVAASVNASQIVLGLSGSRLALFNLNEKDEINLIGFRDLGNREISAVSCTPSDSTAKWTRHISVAYWGFNNVEIFFVKSNDVCLVPACKTVSLPALPCSVLLHDFAQNSHAEGSDRYPTLLAGLTDGTLASFTFKDNELRDQKIISLGDAPVNMAACTGDNRRTVFVCGSRASVLFRDKERLNNSPILLKGVVAVSPLNAWAFSSSLILSTANGLIIGRVRDVDKMHIRSIPLGLDNPRRIAHHTGLKVFGVACTRSEPVRVCDDEITNSSLRVLDDTTFSHLAQFHFDGNEQVTSLENLTLSCNDNTDSYFCAGTFIVKPGEQDPTAGRLRVFRAHGTDGSVSPNSIQLTPAASTDVNGCPYALTNVDGMVAAAVNSSVVIFSLRQEETDGVSSLKLVKITEWNHNYILTSLVTRGSMLILGDVISSISVLILEGQKLRTLARDYTPMWPVSVGALDDKTVISANADFNLCTFRVQSTGTYTALERDGNYHIDDYLTSFLPGQLASPDVAGDFELSPKLLFFCSSGRIGVIIDVGKALSLRLSALQRNMAAVIKGPGGTNHTWYRAPRNAKGLSDADASSVGFLDGDFLELFLNQPAETQGEILKGGSDIERVGMSLSQIQRLLETLQSMH